MLKPEEQKRLEQLYLFESDLYAKGAISVAGLDEVGRGSVAGPLSVCACVLQEPLYIEFLNDSKKLTALRREKVSAALKEMGAIYCVVHIEPKEIDDMGISASLRKAMSEAIIGLAKKPDTVLLDGNPLGISPNEISVVKGDEKIACIAAASVLAKVERDEIMIRFDELYPGYGFASNKGYASAAHIKAIEEMGLSPVHRESFCQNFMQGRLF